MFSIVAGLAKQLDISSIISAAARQCADVIDIAFAIELDATERHCATIAL